jgi:hypothetical protein
MKHAGFDRFRMTWLTTMIQIRTSKKPSTGANRLAPRVINIIRMVPMLTSVILARKISTGNTT